MFDPDLESYLSRRIASPRGASVAPSLFITRDMDPVKEANCRRFGLTPVAATSDDFFEQLFASCAPLPTPLDLVRPSGDTRFKRVPASAIQASFFRQWLFVDSVDNLPDDESSASLLEGIEPRWAHIRQKQDTVRQITANLVSDVSRWSSTDQRDLRIHAIFSGPGQGRSTLLMRTCLELQGPYEVLWYTARERMRPDDTAAALAELRRPAVLVVDNAWAHGHQIAALCERLRSNSTPAFILIAERTVHREQLLEALAISEARTAESKSLPPLDNDEAQHLVREMRRRGLLGEHAGDSDAHLASKLKGHDLVTAIILLNRQAPQLRHVLSAELNALSPDARTLYETICLSHSCGFALRLGIAQRAANIPTASVNRALSELLKGKLVVRDTGPGAQIDSWLSRHRVVSEGVLSVLTVDEKLKIFMGLATALRPYVSRESYIRGRTEAGLSGRLFDYDKFVLPHLQSASLAFYTGVADSWQWNSRYWTQLALLRLDEGNLLTALKHAEQAVAIERHRTTYTTLARVHFEMASSSPLSSEGTRSLRAAMDSIEKSLAEGAHRRRPDVHPYDAGIRGVMSFGEAQEALGKGVVLPARAADFVDRLLREGKGLLGDRKQRDLVRRWTELRNRAKIG